MKLAFLLIAGCAIFCAAPAIAKECDKDSISDKSDSGRIITTLSGRVYEMLDGGMEASLWLPTEDILVCKTSVPLNGKIYDIYEIYNLEERGEREDARLLK